MHDNDREDWSALPQTLYVARHDGHFTFDLTKQVRVRDRDKSIRTEFIGRHSGDGHIETFTLASLLEEGQDLYDDVDACMRRVEVLAQREARAAARAAADQEKAEAAEF